MEKIKIEKADAVELERATNFKAELKFFPDYIEHTYEYDDFIENEKLGIEEPVSFNGNIRVIKKFISSVAYFFITNQKVFAVSVYSCDRENLIIMFDDLEEAKQVQDKIMNWLLT